MGEPVTAAEALCVCGHQRSAHEHHRAGTECAFCGPEACPRYRRRRFWHRRG